MTKFAYVVCKSDKSGNSVINNEVLKNNLKCEKIHNLTKRMPTEKSNFSGIPIKNLRRLRDDFSPFMLGLYDMSGLGNHSTDLYMFSEDAIEDNGKNLEVSLNFIKYEKNYFMSFSMDENGIQNLFDLKDLIVWFLTPSNKPNQLSNEWTKLCQKYQHILDKDDVIYVTKNCLLPYTEARERNDVVRAKLREKMISMLKNGWQ